MLLVQSEVVGIEAARRVDVSDWQVRGESSYSHTRVVGYPSLVGLPCLDWFPLARLSSSAVAGSKLPSTRRRL